MSGTEGYSYWQIIKMNINLFNNKENWVDCMREWIVLLATIVLVYYL